MDGTEGNPSNTEVELINAEYFKIYGCVELVINLN